jgi:hypothetical protein
MLPPTCDARRGLLLYARKIKQLTSEGCTGTPFAFGVKSTTGSRLVLTCIAIRDLLVVIGQGTTLQVGSEAIKACSSFSRNAKIARWNVRALSSRVWGTCTGSRVAPSSPAISPFRSEEVRPEAGFPNEIRKALL